MVISSLVSTPKRGGLGVGSLRAKNLGLLGKWKWQYLTEVDALWRKVVKSFYGSDGGFGSSSVRNTRHGHGVILSMCDGSRRMDRFPRLFSLESDQDCKGLESVRYGVLNGFDTAYRGFLGVWTTFDIFQNIYLLYLQYSVLVFTGYGVLIMFPPWSLVSAGTDTPYLP
ncbi:hypothetical protein Tco_1020125 [Tanacetum coccineum]|uniref:Uncharacterized protein n=1 Tax=Tanacetum coccineum TaxID=301880 RepID=A0ABQ5FZ45_9ASTR